MIATLRGKVLFKNFNSAIIEVNNIGYKVLMNTNKLSQNSEILIYTHLQVKEDAHTLFGFTNLNDLNLFEKLISVKGIGCKTAINFFTMYESHEIARAIEASDIAFLKRLPQIGMKAAQQIILDLKGKLHLEQTTENRALNDAIEALSALGYSSTELKSIQKQLATYQYDSSDSYIKQALQIIAGGKK